jgi:hypothetical protein
LVEQYELVLLITAQRHFATVARKSRASVKLKRHVLGISTTNSGSDIIRALLHIMPKRILSDKLQFSTHFVSKTSTK